MKFEIGDRYYMQYLPHSLYPNKIRTVTHASEVDALSRLFKMDVAYPANPLILVLFGEKYEENI